jgi:hypothetical protein
MSAALTLVIVGFVGSAALALLCFLLGFNKSGLLESADHAAKLVRMVSPDAEFEAIVLDSKGKVALARCTNGQLFVAQHLGDRPVVKALMSQHLSRIDDTCLRVDLKDVGFPKLDFRADKAGLDKFSLNKNEGTNR